MSRLSFAFIAFFALLFIGGGILSYQKENNSLVLFYSRECPHCAEVIRYIYSHRFSRPFQMREVYDSEENFETFKRIAERFKVKTLQVPAIYDPRKERFVVGEEKVLEYIERFER